MADSSHNPSSYLFMVRIWSEAVADDRNEWRGQVQYVSSEDGQTHYFRDWSALVAWLQEMLPVDSRLVQFDEV